MTQPLNDRSKNILREIILSYIAYGEPVGSKCIAKKLHDTISAATIRNIMADLADMGYLEQPHTSAGRVPTDKGYRFFVDQIIQPSLNFNGEKMLDNCDIQNSSYEDVLSSACGQLSALSNQTGLVMLPSFSQMLFQRIEFIKVGPREALAAFVSDMGILQNKLVPIEEEMTGDKLASISRFLNKEFSGKSIKAIRQNLVDRIKNEREHCDQLMRKAVELLLTSFLEEEDATLLVDGALNFLDCPELAADLKRIKKVIKTVEEKTKLIKLLDSCLERDGMTVIIGNENDEEELGECSLVAHNYRMGDSSVGAMAILGHKRMDYQKVITLVNHTAQTVSKLLSEKKRKEFE